MRTDGGLLLYSKLPKCHGDSPISGRIVNFSALFPQPEHLLEERKIAVTLLLETMYDLQAMGCVAASSLYRREPRLNDVIDTYCLIVPHVVPTGKQDNPDYERQICGTGIFIAYLLAKNYATETEIVEAFDQAFLDEAKKPDIQELVAKLLKEGRDAVSPLPRAELFPPQRDNAQLRS